MNLNKNEKNMLIALGATAVVGALILVMVFSSGSQESSDYEWEGQERTTNRIQQTSNSRTFNAAPGSSGSKSTGISIASLSQHNTVNSCWVVIDETVYDISNYIINSSRVSEIAPYCGTFAFQQVFISRTGASKDLIIRDSSLIGPLG